MSCKRCNNPLNEESLTVVVLTRTISGGKPEALSLCDECTDLALIAAYRDAVRFTVRSAAL